MPQILVNVSEKALETMARFDITPDEALDYGVELLAMETPNEENLKAFERSEKDEGIYTAKDEDDFYTSLGLDKWRKH
jgi:hypothetical protein